MEVRSWTALVPLLVVAGVEAQAVIGGRVVGRDGSPWPEARVTLHAAPLLWLRDLERPEEVSVVTDAAGRFTALVTTARRYGIWARDAAAERWTDLAWARAGQNVELVEAADPPVPVRMRLVGLEAWKEVHRLQARLVDAAGAVRRLRRDAEGRMLLHDLPGPSCHVELVDPDGNEVWRQMVPLGCAARQAARAEQTFDRPMAQRRRLARGVPDLANAAEPPLDEEVVLVPPPIAVRVRVIEANDRGVPGARLTLVNSTLTAPSTTSAASGLATLRVPKPVDRWGRYTDGAQLRFLVQAEGYTASLCGVTTGWQSALELVGLEQLDEEQVETTCRLQPGRTLRGQLALPAEVARSRVALLASFGGTTYAFQQREAFDCTEVVEADHEGRFEVRGLGPGLPQLYLGLLLTDPVRRALSPGKPPVAGNDIVDILPAAMPADSDLGQVRLSSLRVADPVVEKPGGGPAPLVHVVAPVLGNARFPAELAAWCDPDGWTDDAGRCRMVVPSAATELLMLREDSYAIVPLESPAGVVPLQPLSVVRGTVVDAEDQPIAWANITGRYLDFPAAPLAVSAWRLFNDAALKAAADERGEFTIRWLPTPGLRFALRATCGSYTFEPVEVKGETVRLRAAEAGR